MKNLSLTFIFTFGVISLLLTACFCKEVKPHWKVTSGGTLSHAIKDLTYAEIGYQDTIQADSIQIELIVQTAFLSHQDWLSPLSNYARATQKCPTDGHQGLKYPIVDLIITSSTDFNQYTAGTDLKPLFNFQGENLAVSFPKLFQNYSFEYLNNGYRRSIVLTEPPATTAQRNFTIKCIFEGGEIVEMTTTDFIW